MNLFELAEKFSQIDYDGFYEKIRIAIQNFTKFAETFPLIIEGVQRLPERVQEASKQWAIYGWAPSLPGDTGADLLNAIHVPESQECADEIMLSKLDGENLQFLFDKIQEKVETHHQNTITYNDAVCCFRNEIYTGCALSLFALIDSCFVMGQPKAPGKKQRDLARKASERAIDNEKAKFFVAAYAVKIIIEDLFEVGNDFNTTKEQGLKRSFVSHGMNHYNPTRTDCSKLFVLLYNIYLMFDSGLYHWEYE